MVYKYESTIEIHFGEDSKEYKIEDGNYRSLRSMSKEYVRTNVKRERGSFGRFVLRYPISQTAKTDVESWVWCYMPLSDRFVFKRGYDMAKAFSFVSCWLHS